MQKADFGECDGQKVVFNARYGDYVDLSNMEFLRALGYGAELFSGELDFQLILFRYCAILVQHG